HHSSNITRGHLHNHSGRSGGENFLPSRCVNLDDLQHILVVESNELNGWLSHEAVQKVALLLPRFPMAANENHRPTRNQHLHQPFDPGDISSALVAVVVASKMLEFID